MRNKNNKHLGIEIDPVLHYKLHYISKYEGRSANGQILYLIRQCIREFEAADGEISVPPSLRATSNKSSGPNKRKLQHVNMPVLFAARHVCFGIVL